MNNGPDLEGSVNGGKDAEYESMEDKLLFVKGVLCLLKETHLFGPLLGRAVDNIDFVLTSLQG